MFVLQARNKVEVLLGMREGDLSGELTKANTSKQSSGTNLCGYYALAYAVSLADYAYAQPPQHVISAIYDESQMEDHLRKIISEEGDDCPPFPLRS